MVLGEPCRSLWPSFNEKPESSDGLALLTLPEWKKGTSVTQVAGTVPEGLTQRWNPEWTNPDGRGWSMRWNSLYPPVFPFGQAPPDCLDRGEVV